MCSKSVKEIKCFNNGNSVFTNIAKLLMYNLPTRSPIDVVLKRNFSKTNVCCKCLYELLNVPRNATQSDIKGAYYKLSMIYHPDKNRGCEDAIKKFREITDAYEVLSNAKSRNQYDEGLPSKSQGPAGTHKPHWEPEDIDDAQARFYKQHMRRKDVPYMTGRTPIYDFDEWNRNHYSELFRKKQQWKRNYKNVLYDNRISSAEKVSQRQNFAFLALLLLAICCLAEVLSEFSANDRDRPIKKDVKR